MGLGASMLADGAPMLRWGNACYKAWFIVRTRSTLSSASRRASREDSLSVHPNVRLSAMIRWSFQALRIRRWCCPLPMVVWKFLSHPENSHWKVAPSKEGWVVGKVARADWPVGRLLMRPDTEAFVTETPVHARHGERLYWGGEITVCLGKSETPRLTRLFLHFS